MALIPRLSVLLLVYIALPGAAFFKTGIKVGINLGSSSLPPASHHLHYCTAKKEQLLKNLYVDYFQSAGPCVAPDGAKLYPFKSTHRGGSEGPTVCAKLPRLCELLGKSSSYRGRSILEAGQTMMKTLRTNMRSLYQMLTGKDSPTASHSDPRSGILHSSYSDYAPYSHTSCDHGGCDSGGGVAVCETVEDLVFPMVGRSALTNATVTVLQAFPDLVQPVFFRRCRNRQAQVVYGECQQQYLPVSLLVAPPYPGAVLAHDFVLVESGCHVAAHVAQHYGETQPRQSLRDTPQEDLGTVSIRESDRRLF
ncbi:uncharacterized protein LOC123505662 isoform X1 [Portunus trituberculatus]|uniref:uncharacterized protein LOC123505662 isoform X1 n=1 Tax=Portunus trituberculatus TaxID=210409 RepID=UPI001E1CF7FD|nr:uncharacterized protein LOC123505662 isoform X1 [Portunus trituberculatus]